MNEQSYRQLVAREMREARKSRDGFRKIYVYTVVALSVVAISLCAVDVYRNLTGQPPVLSLIGNLVFVLLLMAVVSIDQLIIVIRRVRQPTPKEAA